MAVEIMDEHWKKQLKSKAGYVVMCVLGSIFTVLLWFIMALCFVEGADDGAMICMLAMFGTLFLLIFGSIRASLVNKHNRRIEKLFREEFNARKTAEALATMQPQNSTADEIKKYQQLMQDGTITPEEFEAKKQQLLDL